MQKLKLNLEFMSKKPEVKPFSFDDEEIHHMKSQNRAVAPAQFEEVLENDVEDEEYRNAKPTLARCFE